MALADAVSSAVVAWYLDEASGNRADSVGSNTLTDNFTVGSATGKFSNAADFERDNGEYLSIADNADTSFGDIDFMVRLWFQLESKGSGTELRRLFTKGNASGDFSVNIDYYPDIDRIRFEVSPDGTLGSIASVTANNFGSPSTGTWYLLHAWHDSVNNLIGISINAGTADTTSHSTGVNAGGQPLGIGGTSTLSNTHDGLIDDVVLLKGYILDATERSEDYNSGTGVAFADWAGGGGPTYTLTAAAGSFSLTGNSAGLVAGRKLTAGAGSFALTGNTTGLQVSRKIVAGAGAFSLTGNSTALQVARKLAANVGAFSLTGNATTLTYSGAGPEFLRPDGDITTTGVTSGTFAAIDESIASDADYVLGGENTAVTYECSLTNPSGTPGSGTTTVRYRAAKFRDGALATGGATLQLTVSVYQGATLIATDSTRTLDGVWTDYSFTPDMSSVTGWNDLRLRFVSAASGGNATTRRALAVSFAEVEAPAATGPTYTLTASAGSFTMTGQAATFQASRKLVASAGSFTLTGQTTSLQTARKLVAAAGTYNLSGSDAALLAGRKLTAGVGSFTLNGIVADLIYTPTGGPDYTLTAGAGAFTLTGQAANVIASRKITADAGTFTIAGNDTGLQVARKIAADAGAFTLTASDAILVAARKLVASRGTFTLTGVNAGLTYSGAANPSTFHICLNAQYRTYSMPAQYRTYSMPARIAGC